MAALGLALATAVLPACASAREKWAHVPLQGLSYQNLYHAIIDLLEVEGVHVRIRNPGIGTVTSEWQQALSRREVRGPSRRKVHVKIVSDPDVDGAYTVSLRVEEQIIRKGGLLSSGVRQDDDWEAFPDNYEDAEYFVAKIRALLGDYLRQVDVEPAYVPPPERASWEDDL